MSASSIILKASQWRTKYIEKASLSPPSRTAVVVGSTSGIGLAISHRLAEQGFKIIAVGRHREGRAEQIVQALADISPCKDNNDDKDTTNSNHHEFVACDCFSLKDTARAAKEILSKHEKIDALVLTQGMATTQGFTPTIDGNDEKLTLHYFSRIAFSLLLLPALSRSTAMANGAVVLSVLSGGVHSPYTGYRDYFSLENNYSISNAANAAGYYNDLGFDVLAKANPSINFFHAAPGFVNTNWGTEFNPILRTFVRCLQPLGRNPSECAEYMSAPTILSSAYGDGLPAKPENSNGIIVIGDKGQSWPLTKQHTEEAMKFVWEKTIDVLKKAGIQV